MRIILLLIILLSPLFANAQDGHYGRVDIEGGAGISYKRSNYDYFGVGGGFYLEGRYQLKEVPVSVGINLSATIISDLSAAMSTMAVADYQFGRGRRVNPFVGLGGGVSLNMFRDDFLDGGIDPCLTPRVGVRWMKFCSTTLSYTITRRELSRFTFNLGFYF